MKVKITGIIHEATDVRSYRLEAVEPGHVLPEFTAGSHIDVTIYSRLVRQYSICSDPDEKGYYKIGVQKGPQSSGGSEALIRDFREGQIIEISGPRNHFRLDEGGSEFILIGGGIGITPILSMAQRLRRIGRPFRLYYLARSKDRFAFGERLSADDLAPSVTYHDDETRGLPDLATLVGPYRNGLRVYCCGPTALMDAVRGLCAGWPPKSVVFEHFSRGDDPSAGDNRSFEIQIGRDGPVFVVGPDQSILQVLRKNGYRIETQCTQGLCGTCEVKVLAGQVDHRDLVLDQDEQAENSCMMVCCSRAISGRLVLEL